MITRAGSERIATPLATYLIESARPSMGWFSIQSRTPTAIGICPVMVKPVNQYRHARLRDVLRLEGLHAEKLTTEEYIRDARFAAIALGYKVEEKAGWMQASRIPDFLKHFDWSRTAVLCHYAAFDGLILSHHYDVHPAFFLCTLRNGASHRPMPRRSLGLLWSFENQNRDEERD
jgi:hypothetical protein